MTPAELMTRRLRDRLEAAGVTLPVYSLLLEALEGEKHETPSSGVGVSIHIAEQLHEPMPMYKFSATVILTVALDDDKGGRLFMENYNAVWAAFDFLARGDNCTQLGDDELFAVDGFQLSNGSEPDYQTDDNGGTFTTSFAATITGRAM